MSERIRVLLHVDSLVPGGLERKVTSLALGLDRRQFEPIVAWSWQYGIFGDQLQAAGIQVVEIVPVAARCAGVGKATAQIRQLAPDIYHTFSCRQNASDTLVARRARVPIIISARDNMRHWAPRSPARNWEFDRNSRTQYVTPCCEAVAELCRKVEGVNSRRVVVIHNGVELPRISQSPSIRDTLDLPPNPFVIGYAARYQKLKAHENLLRALRKIVDRRPDVHLLCCGADDEGRRAQLEELVVRLSLQNNVTLLGVQHDMDRFYRGLDLYVHASSSEAFSMAILEAMSHRLPVVATRVGGTAESVLDGETGLLVPPSDPRALCDAVLRLRDETDLRVSMGLAGRDRVARHFTVEHMVAGYEALYRRATSPRVPPLPPDAPAFTGGPEARDLPDTTIFITTIGDEVNFADCIAHLQAQTVRCPIVLIDRVAPMSAAFAMMHKLCTTPYYVQVDEDMLLHPHAIESLHDELEQAPEDVAFVCAALWDCDVERAILGVKIYRHAIVRQFPYRNVISCEVRQMNSMKAAGYKTVLHSTDEGAPCLGEHGKHYSAATIFQRWQRLFQKHGSMGHLTWLEPWPVRLLERYMQTREPEHLYAFLGSISGIAGRPEFDRELDWRDANPALQRMNFYFDAHLNKEPK